MRANTVTMHGNVLLTKDKNVLRGDRLVVDLTTGVSRVESNSGRVQGVFQAAPSGFAGRRQLRRRAAVNGSERSWKAA